MTVRSVFAGVLMLTLEGLRADVGRAVLRQAALAEGLDGAVFGRRLEQHVLVRLEVLGAVLPVVVRALGAGEVLRAVLQPVTAPLIRALAAEDDEGLTLFLCAGLGLDGEVFVCERGPADEVYYVLRPATEEERRRYADEAPGRRPVPYAARRALARPVDVPRVSFRRFGEL